MKELSIEEKAKAYDNIIEKANKMHCENCEACQICIEELIPELKESEDERIRKDIIVLVKDWWDRVNKDNISTKEQMIAWLEDQGAHYNFRKKIQVGDQVTRNRDGVLVNLSQLKRVAKPADVGESEKQGEQILANSAKTCKDEQKPVEWSEEDKTMLCYMEGHLEYLKNDKGYSSSEDQIMLKRQLDWLKSLKDRVQLQPKCEWSEEDKKILDRIESEFLAQYRGDYKNIEFNDVSTLSVLNWIRDLKTLRPQPKQEWSEEDETVLNNLIYALANDRIGNDRDEYVDWLKSLKDRVWPKQELSEEDEDVINNACAILTRYGNIVGDEQRANEIYKTADRLKSLSPQSHWKPSDEQMEALEHFIVYHNGSTNYAKDLEELRLQLKKLKGE